MVYKLVCLGVAVWLLYGVNTPISSADRCFEGSTNEAFIELSPDSASSLVDQIWLDIVWLDDLHVYKDVVGGDVLLASSLRKDGTGLGSNFYEWAIHIPDTMFILRSLSSSIGQFEYDGTRTKLLVDQVDYGERFLRYRSDDSLDFKISHYLIDLQSKTLELTGVDNTECTCK